MSKEKELKWAIGTIVFMGIVSFFLIPLIISNVKVVFENLETTVGEPKYPIFKQLYGATKPIYEYLKTIVSSHYGLAVLISVSLVAIALEIEWKKRS